MTNALGLLRNSLLARYSVALVAAVIMLALRGALAPIVEVGRAPYLSALLAVALAAWFGGWGPGVLATACTVIGVQLFFSPEFAWSSLGTEHLVRMGLFVVQGVVVSVLIDQLVRARGRSAALHEHRILELAVAQTMVGASTGPRAVEGVMHALGEQLGAEIAVMWQLSEERESGRRRVLESSSVLIGVLPTARSNALRTFLDARIAEARTSGFAESDPVSRALRTGHPTYDASSDLSPNTASGVRSAIAVPIVASTVGSPDEAAPVAVMEFRRAAPFQEDPAVVVMLRSLSLEIGQFMRWRAAERQIDLLNTRLAQRVEELQAILDTAPIGIAVALDAECNDVAMNPAGAAMLGIARGTNASLSGSGGAELPFRVMCEGRELRGDELPMQRASKEVSAVGPIEVELHRADGSVRTLYEFAAPLLGGSGQPRGCVGIFVDITPLRHAERTLRTHGEELRASFESAGVGIAQLHPETGAIERANRRLVEMLGRTAAALGAITIFDVLDEEERPAAESMFRRLVDGNAEEYRAEHRYRHDDGTSVWGMTTATVVATSEGQRKRVVAVIQDATDRKRAEQESDGYRSRLEELVVARTSALEETHQRLRFSERMAALGTLSDGLGHDMGNLLLPVRLRIESMEIKGIPPSLKDDVQAIGKCAEYLQRLADGLRLLSLDPDQTSATEVTELDGWWRDIESFLKNALPRGVELERTLEAGLPPLYVSRHRLTQAVFNLVQNAGDAVRGRPDGRVRLWAVHGHEPNTVRLGVTDNGSGMTAEVKARCLEPFFTSKVRSLSTGLGLSLVHSIMQQSRGTIEIESVPDHGATFTLTFLAAGTSERSLEPPAVHSVKVVIAFSDLRLAHYAVSVATALGAEVERLEAGAPVSSDGLDSDAALVWATDAATISPEAAREFLGPDHAHRRSLLLFGDPPDALKGWLSIQFHDRLTPASIRTALRAAVIDASEQDDDGGDSGDDGPDHDHDGENWSADGPSTEDPSEGHSRDERETDGGGATRSSSSNHVVRGVQANVGTDSGAYPSSMR
ncbi:MAG: PAS domain-containing sensor histidine kinase [Phycisphaerae bacterium]|nr:PAS domain-containing sensor histidine kinase [Phycisphaerae bacterium]